MMLLQHSCSATFLCPSLTWVFNMENGYGALKVCSNKTVQDRWVFNTWFRCLYSVCRISFPLRAHRAVNSCAALEMHSSQKSWSRSSLLTFWLSLLLSSSEYSNKLQLTYRASHGRRASGALGLQMQSSSHPVPPPGSNCLLATLEKIV